MQMDSSDPPEPPENDMPPVPEVEAIVSSAERQGPGTQFQLTSLAISNAAVLLVVLIVSSTAGEDASVPAAFIYLELVIVVISALLCSMGALAQWGGELAKNAPEAERRSPETPAPGTFRAWWEENHERVQGFFVIPLAALMVFSLVWLIHSTDGRMSPFIALLEAPAVLGPFIAASWKGIALSAVSVSLGVVFAILAQPLHEPDYSPGGHVAVVVFVIAVAATISGVQKYLRARELNELHDAQELARRRSLFIVRLRYDAPRVSANAHLESHDAHVASLYEKGRFATAEHRTTTGGVILARAETPEEVRGLMEEDPAVVAGVATYEIRQM